jgi:Ca2+-transporting ATPase
MIAFYTETTDKVLDSLQTSLNGLNKAEVDARLAKYGPNKVDSERKENLFLLFLKQFQSMVIYILIFSALLSTFFHSYIDAFIILGVILVNAILGFSQEYKAIEAISSLKKMVVAKAKVVRQGKLSIINAEDLVVGDILELEEGDNIPADCRLIYTKNFQTVEAALTGESKSIFKQTKAIKEKKSFIGEQINMSWMGTFVSGGSAKAVVTGTGFQTEFGKIAKNLNAKPKVTRFQKQVDYLIKQISFITIFSAMASPRPVPPFLSLVKKASNNFVKTSNNKRI